MVCYPNFFIYLFIYLFELKFIDLYLAIDIIVRWNKLRIEANHNITQQALCNN